jgi:hypothetical protein
MDSYRPNNSATRLLGLLLALLLPCTVPAAPVQLEVRDPYLDLHTGPGRGYPIAQSIERGATIEIRHRRTDWYQVHTEVATGWVHRDQLRATLAAAGTDGGLRAALLERRIEGRLMAGLSAGAFDDDPVVSFWAGYRLTPLWSAELAIAQAAGDYSSTRMYRLEAVAHPWPGLRFPPHLLVGIGFFENTPRQTLVEGEDDALVFTLGLGLSKQLEPRFALRADWRWHHARFDDNDHFDHFHELTAGFVLLF